MTPRPIPHDLDAEVALLSAALTDPHLVVPLLAGLPGDALYHPNHVLIASAILGLVEDGIHPDQVTVNARLERDGVADQCRHDLLGLAVVGIPTAAPGYVAVLLDHYRRRLAIALAAEVDVAARDGHHARVAALLERGVAEAHDPADDGGGRVVTGDVWALDLPPGIPALWGTGDQVLWAEGEALIIVGPPGTGKTTITGQVVAMRIGALDGDVLGFPVAPTDSRVLWLAMDRPRQIQRAFARLVQPDHRDVLRERLVVWQGPPPADFARHPDTLTRLARRHGADTVVVDSLKDAAVGLVDDEVGAGLNRSRQTALAEGIEVLELHHQRKGQNGHKPRSLEDVYGSTWITAGAGSVVLLWGSAGDPIVELTHLKQPGEKVGPLKVQHDALTGLSAVLEGWDLLGYLRGQPRPVSARDAAHAKHGQEPDEKQVEAVRQQLARRVGKGVVKVEDEGADGRRQVRWAAAETRHAEPLK